MSTPSREALDAHFPSSKSEGTNPWASDARLFCLGLADPQQRAEHQVATQVASSLTKALGYTSLVFDTTAIADLDALRVSATYIPPSA